MIIVDKCLEKTLVSLAETFPEQFPFDHKKHCYGLRYSEMSGILNRDYHPNVEAGSSASDGGLLTDHGPDHIKTVINRAAALLNTPKNTNALSGYEIYLLLCAIHFHDLGNIFGRLKHEKRIEEMMVHVNSHMGDNVERRYIRQIAEAHGGKVSDEKDTIRHLEANAVCNGIDIRPQLLAAILRFADELADDRYRAKNVLLKLDVIPNSSLIYHKYAFCLHSVMVRPASKTVEMHFSVAIEDLVEPFPKYNYKTEKFDKQFILDEIFERCLKTYLERAYCNRFTTPSVEIRSIVVTICCTKKREKIGDQLPEVNFRLEERGYPDGPVGGIHELDSDLNDWNGSGKKLTGAAFSELISAVHLSEDDDE